ncbi:hypothetical protein GALMADRAFT_207176 [Galerina marginata CBS 339.88]|uniref:Uncharacterized protein n=1 Tax=Galerina marginata (strain CBS 339.88) TaxID=685588 RepID=A0A067TEV5_GALM3|nr:hypothetical protein GALMADRAFT_207176 [Galerina marginata CBS 339.88]
MATPSTTLQLINSPTVSYDMVSDHSGSSSMSQSLRLVDDDDSDDEIVWSVSEGSLSPSSSESDESAPSDEDYVVLSRPRSPTALVTGLSTPIDDETFGLHTPVTASISLVEAMNSLSLTSSGPSPKKSKKKAKKVKAAKQAPTTPSKQQKPKTKKKAVAVRSAGNVYPSPAPSPKAAKRKPAPVHPIQEKGGNDWFEEMSVMKFTGLGERPIVDDYSDRQSIISYETESVASPTLYEEASVFISSFLSNPDAKNDAVCKLALLQSLIIELGLATPSLPESLTAAKAFLKSRAFLNIREYLAVRGQGPEAVQGLLYPSRSALIKDIKKKRNPASLKWVKQHGLQVLLVGWMH